MLICIRKIEKGGDGGALGAGVDEIVRGEKVDRGEGVRRILGPRLVLKQVN
jgi:hypothetical protein